MANLKFDKHDGGDANHLVKVNAGIRLEADREEVENATGMGGGPEMIRIRLNDEQGLGAFFWVSATFNKQGRPVVQVSTEVGDEKVVKKSVVGVCKKL